MYQVTDKALRAGNMIHAFRSGGGLRVVRIEEGHKRGKLLGYGEHFNIETAFAYAEMDLVKHIPYDKFYGKIVPHYLTGSSDPSSVLDHWILKGYAFDIKFVEGNFVFEAEFKREVRLSKELQDEVVRTGKSINWKFKDREYLSERISFANGTPGCRSTCLTVPTGYNYWVWEDEDNVCYISDSLDNLLKEVEPILKERLDANSA